jgi:AraC family transcriptional activator of tynA and feaB
MVAIAAQRERRCWSTHDVEPRRALAYCIDTVCDSFMEIDIDSPVRDGFRARLEQAQFGPTTLCMVEADTQTVRRTAARIASSRYAAFFLLRLRSGELRLRQYGRESQVHAGDCVLIDCKEPYQLDCLPTTRCVALRCPQDWLRNWIPAPETIAARPFAANTGWGAALSAALANLDPDMAEDLALPDGIVADQIAALLALAAGPDVQASTPRTKLLGRLLHTLRDRCCESDLTPSAVADAHGISKRYLHHLFAQSGTTFGNELVRMRLDSARRLLADKRFSTISIGEVAARCGFVEQSHFARRFRAMYGQGPTQFRGAHDGKG